MSGISTIETMRLGKNGGSKEILYEYKVKKKPAIEDGNYNIKKPEIKLVESKQRGLALPSLRKGKELRENPL